MVSGVSTGWTEGLGIGTGNYLVCFALCAMAYVCVALCVAEMSGMVSFAGGCYGFARCALSPLLGFLVGACDLLQTIIYTASMVHVVAKALSIASTSAAAEDFLPLLPVWYLVVYAALIVLALPGVPFLLKCINIATCVTLALLLLYGFMNVSRWDFNHYAQREVSFFAGSAGEFFGELVTPAHCFIGVNLISLFSEEAKDAERTIPRAMLSTLGVMIVFATWMTFTIVSVSPGNSHFMIEEVSEWVYLFIYLFISHCDFKRKRMCALFPICVVNECINYVAINNWILFFVNLFSIECVIIAMMFFSITMVVHRLIIRCTFRSSLFLTSVALRRISSRR